MQLYSLLTYQIIQQIIVPLPTKWRNSQSKEPGFLGVESARDHSGLGITISYWESLEAIENWKQNALHKEAKKEAVSNGMKTSTCASALLSKNLSFIEVHCNYEEKISSHCCS